jgi:hypothetical protein
VENNMRRNQQQKQNPKKEKTEMTLDRSDLLIETPFARSFAKPGLFASSS